MNPIDVKLKLISLDWVVTMLDNEYNNLSEEVSKQFLIEKMILITAPGVVIFLIFAIFLIRNSQNPIFWGKFTNF